MGISYPNLTYISIYPDFTQDYGQGIRNYGM